MANLRKWDNLVTTLVGYILLVFVDDQSWVFSIFKQQYPFLGRNNGEFLLGSLKIFVSLSHILTPIIAVISIVIIDKYFPNFVIRTAVLSILLFVYSVLADLFLSNDLYFEYLFFGSIKNGLFFSLLNKWFHRLKALWLCFFIIVYFEIFNQIDVLIFVEGSYYMDYTNLTIRLLSFQGILAAILSTALMYSMKRWVFNKRQSNDHGVLDDEMVKLE